MKRIALLLCVLLVATSVLSGAASYKSSVRPLFYGKQPVCTAWQLEEYPEMWITAGHCYTTGLWEEVAENVYIYKPAPRPTIDGHPADWLYVEAGMDGLSDIAILRTPGYDVPGLDLGRDPKLNQKVEISGYRKAVDWDSTIGFVKHPRFIWQVIGDGPKMAFIVDRLKLDDKHLGPTFGSSGSPVLSRGRVVGVMVGGVQPTGNLADIPSALAVGDIAVVPVSELQRILDR